jgi:hypothetical protein
MFQPTSCTRGTGESTVSTETRSSGKNYFAYFPYINKLFEVLEQNLMELNLSELNLTSLNST